MYIPVITIDGPSASGKGTVAALIARQLGFHYLDSGCLYRLCALSAERAGIFWLDEDAVASIASVLPVRFEQGEPLLDDEPVGEQVRSEHIGMGASQVAALPAVRQALLARQRAFRLEPGLVADGRDMGTVVFPDAGLKIFLVASAEERAKRRYKQLIDKGESANLARIKADIDARDARDAARAASPLVPADDAKIFDTTDISIEQVVATILDWYQAGQ